MRWSACSVALLFVSGVDAEDSLVVLDPPSTSSSQSGLLVYVPGGLVPNKIYVPMLQEVQRKISGEMDLWVSIASCPSLDGSAGGLCIPSFSNANITAALDAGRKASGVSAPKQTWLGGHSLGGAATDFYATHDGLTEIQGGAILMGDNVFEGPQAMLSYPVPVLSLLGELNFGSTRPMKMAPYFAAAAEQGHRQLLRTPLVVVKDIDHSDMCEGFHVEGDLPSAIPAAEATEAISSLTADFMLSQLLPERAVELMTPYLEFSREYFAPMNAALDLDLYSAGWCEQLQLELAGPFADKVSVVSTYHNDSVYWHAPSAKVVKGKVEIVVTGRNTYESDKVWPPQDPWPFGTKLRSATAPPPVERDTPMSQGCRMISQSRIAELLGVKVLPESTNFCEKANRAAWTWAQKQALQRSLDRYASQQPCNDCSPAVAMVFHSDLPSKDLRAFKNSSLGYDFSADALIVQSPSLLAGEEHSCMLLSPSRALDFLLQDAFQANIYGAPSQLPLVV